VLLSITVQADINKNLPPFSLTLTQAENWTPESQWADKNNISTVPLKARIIAQLGDRKKPLDDKTKVLIAPDGMNNLANYLTEQKKFNLYNFTHWSHIDVLNWFAGTANETVNLPSRPWVETAHRNGVKVIGTVYLSVAQYGGNVSTVEQLLKQDENGGFPIARQLIAIAKYYGFDGWLINPETDLTLIKDNDGNVIKGEHEYVNAARLGKKMQAFMAYLTLIADQDMEIHWYDSMLLNGSVSWQNELNEKNQPFLQDAQAKKSISDAMFMNYWWDEDMLVKSHDYVLQLGRSPYDLYFGADLSPARNAQKIYEQYTWLYSIFSKATGKALSSIALFGNDVTFTFAGDKKNAAISNFRTDKTDYRRFYNSETRLFAGDDLNLFVDDEALQWPGIGRFVPAKSTITTLPFKTSFNTGHGLFKADNGKKVYGEWHDISQQDILPTWQFAIQGEDNVFAYYDFEQVFMGGSSLALRVKKNGVNKKDDNKTILHTLIPLYKTALLLKESAEVSVTFKHNSTTRALWVWLETTDKIKIQFPLIADDDQWTTLNIDLQSYEGKVIDKIGFMIQGHSENEFSSNIGLVEIK